MKQSGLYQSMRIVFCLITLLCAFPRTAPAMEEADYVGDIRFALEEMEKQCGKFFKVKNIDWKKVSKEFLKEAKKVETDQEHLVLLSRLIARLRDGHARVQPMDRGKEVKWPDDGKGSKTGLGMFWCKVKKKIYVKNAWSTAKGAGIDPGTEVIKVNGKSAAKWLAGRIEEMSDLSSFSTDQQALFFTCHWGLSNYPGERLELELKDPKGKKKKRTLTYAKAGYVPWGPAFFPENCLGNSDIRYTTTENGFGYIHLRRCKGQAMLDGVDEALAALGKVPGLILDFRANGGGGFDHQAFMGRFVPKGETLQFNMGYPSAGEHPYGGPIVVIVDGNTRSAGETGSGIFKEDGRAYMIGESCTAGMSSSKTTIELPSGLFSLYVSIHSNKARFNQGRGIEGIGVIPHETVPYNPKDLAAGIDTLTVHAEKLLKKFPQKEVPYDPAKFGWKK